MNVHFIMGNVGRDPEFRTFSNGGKICTMSVASSERWKDKDGEWKDRTTWHNVVLRSPYALKVAESIRKGNRVVIQGKVETRSFDDKDGNKRYTTETIVNFDGTIAILHNPGAGNEGSDRGSSVDEDEIPF